VIDVDTTGPTGPAAEAQGERAGSADQAIMRADGPEAVQQAPGERGMVSPAAGTRDGRVGMHGRGGAPDAGSESRADASTSGVESEAPVKPRKAKTTSPTARTLAECRKRGWTAQVVEQNVKIPGGRAFKRDLFGVIDIVAITPQGLLGIQTTGGKDSGVHANRLAKILAEPRARRWIEAGGRLELWSWAMRGAAGTRKLWTLRTEVITLEHAWANVIPVEEEGQP
jgi:hypothetical protein